MAAGFRSPFWPFGVSAGQAPVITPETEATLLNIPTSWRQLGLAVVYGDNLNATVQTPTLGSLSEKIESYSHEIRAIGGFWSASITFKDTPSNIRDWLENGVGRHIEVYDQAGTVVWEGFVDKVSATIENVQIERGPLISAEVGNRCKVRYSVADYSSVPASVGVTLTTTTVNNTDSQAKYGIIEKAINLNEATSGIATIVRDAWLREHAFPQSAINSSFGSGSEPSVSLECLGYWHYLNTWVYSSSAASTQEITDKIQTILASSPNDIFSTDYSYMESNSSGVKRQENQDRNAATIIAELLEFSDASFNKYIGGIYEGRVFHYGVVPETVEYYQETGGVLRGAAGAGILPWNVRPGKWIYYSGLLNDTANLNGIDNLYRNPVTGLVETASFSSPFEVSISTKRLSKLDQMFTRLGITSP